MYYSRQRFCCRISFQQPSFHPLPLLVSLTQLHTIETFNGFDLDSPLCPSLCTIPPSSFSNFLTLLLFFRMNQRYLPLFLISPLILILSSLLGKTRPMQNWTVDSPFHWTLIVWTPLYIMIIGLTLLFLIWT